MQTMILNKCRMHTSGFLVKPEIPVRETLRLWQVFIPNMDQPFSIYGIFTYKTGCFFWGACWCAYSSTMVRTWVLLYKPEIHGLQIQPFPASIEGAHQVQGWFINPANYRYIMIYPPQAQQFFELWLPTLISISYKT